MKIASTARRFEIIQFQDINFHKCTLQQSSLALYTQPGSSAIWLGRGDTRMHLHKDLLEDLLPHLNQWFETGSFGLDKKQ